MQEQYKISGPQGGLSSSLVLPPGFDAACGKCPLVVLFHGFLASKDLYPFPQMASLLAKRGIASLSFDFEAHGRSEGEFAGLTLSNELADAKAAVEYAESLPFVQKLAFVGHSKGGLIAALLAAELEDTPLRPACMTLLAPAASMIFDARKGKFLYARFDAQNPPEYLDVLSSTLSRKFLLELQTVPIYETAPKYSGPVHIVHGGKDEVVSLTYSLQFRDVYKDCSLKVFENECHMLDKAKEDVIEEIVSSIERMLK